MKYCFPLIKRLSSLACIYFDAWMQAVLHCSQFQQMWKLHVLVFLRSTSTGQLFHHCLSIVTRQRAQALDYQKCQGKSVESRQMLLKTAFTYCLSRVNVRSNITSSTPKQERSWQRRTTRSVGYCSRMRVHFDIWIRTTLKFFWGRS